MHHFGLGCIKNCALWPIRMRRRMFVFVAVLFRNFVSRTSVPSVLQPKNMAERTRDDKVVECKGFLPPNVPTTSAPSTRLHLGSLHLNTGAYNTGTATPPRRILTESQRSADLARKRARYAQRTKGQCLMHDAHK